jgi:HK97 family phage major capsid protein
MAQSARDYLEQERQAKLNDAKSLTDKAEEEGRSLATEEKEKIAALMKEADEIKGRVQEYDEQEKLRKDLNSMIGAVSTGPAEKSQARSLGEAFVNSEAFQTMLNNDGFKSSGWKTGPVEIPYGFKEALTGTELTTGNSEVVQPSVQPSIQPLLLRRLTIADLIPAGTTDSNTVRVIAEEGGSTGSVNAAAATAETAEKPESRIRLEEVDEPVRKIATILPVSDEMLEDVPGLRSFIDSRLRLFIQHAEEDELLNGDGTPPSLSGILDRSVQTDTQANLADTAHDAVFSAITAIRDTAHAEPSGIVVNPTDWEGFRLTKDQNDQYYGGGPFTGAYGNGGIAGNFLWQLPVVVTGAVAAGTVLVGAFNTQAQVFRRGGLTVEASNSHNDYFARNMTAIRAEERLALAVYRPDAFYAITSVEFGS